MPIFQTTFTQRNDIAVAGMLAEAFGELRTTGRNASGLLRAGLAAFKVPVVGGAGTPKYYSPGQVFQNPVPGLGADVDAIIASGASSTSVQNLSGAALTGATGGTDMQPARLVTLVLSSHADWDATNATLTGVNYLGQTVSETIAIPNGGNATVTSTNRFIRVTSLSIPVQSGAGGTFTLGVAALAASLTVADVVGVVKRQVCKASLTQASVYGYPGLTSTQEAQYIDGELVPMLTRGAIWVVTEEAVSDGDPIYVRVAAGTGTQLGAFRNDDDSSSCVLMPGRFTRDCASGLASIRFDLF